MAKVTAVTGEQDPTAAAIRELVQLVRVTALCVRSIHPAPNADELVGRVERGAHDRSATREGREVGVPLSVVVLSDKQVSSAVTLPRGAARGFAVACPSNGTAAAIFIEFALTSGTAPFQRLQRSDGTGAYVVHSGTGDAVG